MSTTGATTGVFVLSFFFNALWENAHSFLYASYEGGAVTESILLRASLGDAVILTLLSLPLVLLPFSRKHVWMMCGVAVLISIGIELFALHTGRWTYSAYMPRIPYLGVGLTPTVQLGFIGYLIYSLLLASSAGTQQKTTRQ